MPPRTNGLTRSPPGVATAEKIAIARITYRREAASAADVTIPTRDSAYRTIGNSITQPERQEHGRHEVEVRPRREPVRR